MSITQAAIGDQWFLLGVFFVIFAVYGFTKSTRGKGCKPCNYIAFGVMAVVLNSLLLFIAHRTGVDQFNIIQLLTLKEVAIESSFIVFGYCLMIQGTAMFIKDLFTPASVRAYRTYL